MNADTIIAMAGLVALGAAAFTGAIWDSPLVASPSLRRQRPYGRHAMPADTPATTRVAAHSGA
ncbi:hypothetical protein [Mycobacterium sp. B14F4]|uniref:hypothetical protein n=1 Tax=Mycobacterium sp. B14F4 TaxID=3153565 RepID=UPI00325FB3E0